MGSVHILCSVCFQHLGSKKFQSPDFVISMSTLLLPSSLEVSCKLRRQNNLLLQCLYNCHAQSPLLRAIISTAKFTKQLNVVKAWVHLNWRVTFEPWRLHGASNDFSLGIIDDQIWENPPYEIFFVKIKFDVCLISSTTELFAKSEADRTLCLGASVLCLRSRHTHTKQEITV